MAITKSNKQELSLDYNKPNEGFQTWILKSQPLLELLHFLALERCFSAEQMSKRPQKEM
jgi:hypothetical protein